MSLQIPNSFAVLSHCSWCVHLSNIEGALVQNVSYAYYRARLFSDILSGMSGSNYVTHRMRCYNSDCVETAHLMRFSGIHPGDVLIDRMQGPM